MTVKTHVNPTKSDSKLSTLAYKNKETMKFNLSYMTPYERIIHLQRTIGNRAVGQLLSLGHLQTKLWIGRSNDKYGIEADRISDSVMNMPEPTISDSPCSYCQESELQTKLLSDYLTPIQQDIAAPETNLEDEEEPNLSVPVQVKSNEGGIPSISSSLDHKNQSLKQGGTTLSRQQREYKVRMHTESQAADSARSVGAKAFTKGKDVVFGEEQYSPRIIGGKRLLAHELAHMLQKSYPIQRKQDRQPGAFFLKASSKRIQRSIRPIPKYWPYNKYKYLFQTMKIPHTIKYIRLRNIDDCINFMEGAQLFVYSIVSDYLRDNNYHFSWLNVLFRTGTKSSRFIKYRYLATTNVSSQNIRSRNKSYYVDMKLYAFKKFITRPRPYEIYLSIYEILGSKLIFRRYVLIIDSLSREIVP